MITETSPLSPRHWYDSLSDLIRTTSQPEAVQRHFRDSRERIIFTVDLLKRLGLEGKRVCELGPGGVGLACSRILKSRVEAFDHGEWFKPTCDHFGIPWSRLNLNQSARLPAQGYDAILLCEVIEHLARWPAEILEELKESLIPGGVLLITTQNLHRLSNRVRMLLGRRLFANFVPEELIMAHLREYTPEELEFFFERAGFIECRSSLVTIPERSNRLVRGVYRLTCRLRPKLANFIFCWGYKPPTSQVRGRRPDRQ